MQHQHNFIANSYFTRCYRSPRCELTDRNMDKEGDSHPGKRRSENKIKKLTEDIHHKQNHDKILNILKEPPTLNFFLFFFLKKGE